MVPLLRCLVAQRFGRANQGHTQEREQKQGAGQSRISPGQRQVVRVPQESFPGHPGDDLCPTAPSGSVERRLALPLEPSPVPGAPGATDPEGRLQVSVGETMSGGRPRCGSRRAQGWRNRTYGRSGWRKRSRGCQSGWLEGSLFNITHSPYSFRGLSGDDGSAISSRHVCRVSISVRTGCSSHSCALSRLRSPSPARFALHKLVVSQRRSAAFAAKSR